MKCPRCQHENPPQAKFCLECGTRFVLTCTKCGTELPAGAKFCLECGQSVSVQPNIATRFISPETYTPKHLAEKILTSKSALEGERKQVTVLFADMKGSMELLADRDPEGARKILDPILEHMMEAVHRYEGTVNQVMGDGIMALFGAPFGARGPRGACRLRCAQNAGVGEKVCRRGSKDRGHSDTDSNWLELGRSGGAVHRKRPQDGLHRGRPDDPFGCSHGADGDAGVHHDDRGYADN